MKTLNVNFGKSLDQADHKHPQDRALSKFIVLTALALGLLLHSSTIYSTQLRAGVAKVNITNMDVGGVVKDSVYARALVFENGSVKAVIISVDIGGVGSFLDNVRMQLQKELNIKPGNVMINASHLHTARTACVDIDKRIVRAVKLASQRMVPVNVGVGKGYEDRISENRRLVLKNGKEWTIRHANPLPPDEEVSGIGPIDPEIGILRVDRKNGTPLAVVYNFACHPYQDSWRSLSLGTTADFPGFASKVIEDNLGDGAVALFLQGAGGNITTVLYKDVDNPRDAEPLGNMLGLSTLQALKKIQSKPGGDLKVIDENIMVPRRTDIPQLIDSLKAQQARLLHSLRGTSLNIKTFIPLYIKYSLSNDYPSYYSHMYLHEKAIGRHELEGLDTENRRNMKKYLANIYAMDKLARIQEQLEGQLARQTNQGDKSINIEVQGMRIGNFVLVTNPGELFVEIGLNIKKASPHENTFVAGYTNGSIGYAPSADHYKGGYEDTSTRLAPEWQKIYENKVLEILKKL